MKNISDDLAALAAHVAGECKPIILGGHDWGGAVVWRFALWHPELLQGVFSVCTPYTPPRAHYVSLDALVQILPNFKYQLQLAGPEVEAGVVGKEKLRAFLNSLYYGRGPNGERGFTISEGVVFANLDKIGQSPLLSREEVDYYAEEYARHGLHGPLSWYRTTKFNFDEEQALVAQGPEKLRIAAPALFIAASKDAALPPAMAAQMDGQFDNLVKREVNAGHWALWEATEETNKHIGEFVSSMLNSSKL